MPPFAPRRPSAGGEPKSSPRFEGPCSATGQTSPAPPAFREGGVAGGAHHDWGGLRSTKGKLVDRVGPPRVAVSPTTSSCVWHCSASAASSALSCSTVNPSWSLGPGVDGVAALRGNGGGVANTPWVRRAARAEAPRAEGESSCTLAAADLASNGARLLSRSATSFSASSSPKSRTATGDGEQTSPSLSASSTATECGRLPPCTAPCESVIPAGCAATAPSVWTSGACSASAVATGKKLGCINCIPATTLERTAGSAGACMS
mmetsp:Transcript_74935/g.188640  ORF Transcript_74935/g.188640 Transcript_74935/m.188640 type:complete len:262 (+) Transcript_74935:727-1512(+)